MKPEQALTSVAGIATHLASGDDLALAGKAVVEAALAAHPARAAFFARSESEAGIALRWIHGRQSDGAVMDPQQQSRMLARVEAAVREFSAGVDSPPPEMTGGLPPEGAMAIKADAGNPPVFCFPLFEGADRGSSLLGVLGFLPDPVAHGDPDATANQTLTICRDLARARLRSELDGERSRTIMAAALGTPPSSGVEGDEGELSADPRGFRYRYDELITRSPKMYDIFKKLDKVIHLDVPILIQGENGTGKELVARAIHRNSPRRKRRFYAQNCGAISESLLESELFGYVKGAFTGADKDRKGLFEIASGSTLFLDEIGEMNFEMQKKLLRVLQEKEVLPLGSTTPIKVDVRIVCATNRVLQAEIDGGRFREDLFHRLNVVRIDLPSLRERPEDIPYLVEHFLKKIARARNDKSKVLDRRDPRIMKQLVDFPWPGNIRQLENIVTRLVHLSGELITWDALIENRELFPEPEKREAEQLKVVRPLDEVVEAVEREEISNALKQTNGNRTRAAALLKINRRSLLRRLKKYGLASAEDEAALAGDEAE